MEIQPTGRFAPTPSGRMHLGNLFSALIAWLSIRKDGGQIVLRLEDLDQNRCKAEYARQLEEDLLFLGFDWDEGGSLGGKHGPYVQHKRTPLYQEQLEKLMEQGLIYPCFVHAQNCTPQKRRMRRMEKPFTAADAARYLTVN